MSVTQGHHRAKHRYASLQGKTSKLRDLPLTQRWGNAPEPTPEQERRAMRVVATSVPKEDVRLVLERLGLA